jgi:hypothetical protein
MAKKSLFDAPSAAVGLEGLVEDLRIRVGNGANVVPETAIASMIGLESLDAVVATSVGAVVRSFGTSLEEMLATHSMGDVTPAQKKAAVSAALLCNNVEKHFATDPARKMVATEGMRFVDLAGSIGQEKRTYGMESYDEKNSKDLTAFSIAYNLQAARQDEFGEAFFPTYTVSPDQFGFSIEISLVQVFDDFVRNVNGNALGNFGRKNVIHASIDPTILRNDATKAVPVYRTEAADKFVANNIVAPYDVMVDGQAVTTAPLLFGKRMSLIDLSQTEASVKAGLMDYTDALDTMIHLKNLYLSVSDGAGKTDVVRIAGLQNMSSSLFTKTVQGADRLMQLTMDTKQLLVSNTLKQVDGSDLDVLKQIVTDKLSVRFGSFLSGTAHLTTGDVLIQNSGVEVTSVQDKDGEFLALNSGVGLAIVQLFANAKLEGWDPEARRVNSNARQRGQLLDLSKFSMMYSVPLLGPISVLRSLHDGSENDTSDLASLIMTTHIMASAAAVAKLQDTAATLAAQISHNGGVMSYDPEMFGIARLVLTPHYEKAQLIMKERLANVKAHEWAADVQATIVNKMRDMVYRAYRDTGFKAVADAFAGGVAPTPTVIIGTDTVLARYIMVDSDFRTLGNDFNVKLVTTLNQNMKGKIYMAFGVFDGSEGTPNPLHFGNMAWKPEVVVNAQISRRNQTSKELTVAPSYTHIVHTPILMELDIVGIHDVVATRTPIDFHNV